MYLKNNQGVFEDVTESLAPDLLFPGMVTDAVWGGVSSKEHVELVLAGEWMPIKVFHYDPETGFTQAPGIEGLSNHLGWWNTVELHDLDGDGDLDILAGNKGLNSGLQANSDEPVIVYASDMDANGQLDAVMTHVLNGSRHAIYWRNELIQHIPGWQVVFPDQTTYAQAAFEDLAALIPPDALEFTANDFNTHVFENNGSGSFSSIDLPIEVQQAPVQAFVVHDFDQNGDQDILLAGNNYATRAEWGRDNAGEGLLLLGSPNLKFEALAFSEMGASLQGDVRTLVRLRDGRILVTENDGPLRMIAPGLGK